MWRLLRFLFFLIDAEKAHYLAMNLLSFALRLPLVNFFLKKSFELENKELESVICGMKAKNPIGLAAGFDKDGRWLELISLIGFGHIEVGTVTPLPQPGNQKPRLFRLKKDHSIINRMGFNNDGVDALVDKLLRFHKPPGLILGGNIGKNKNTSPENAVNDYIVCFQKLYDYVDYFAINVSSPNTPGLRQLQDKEPLHQLLSKIQAENRNRKNPKPLFLKIAPDLDTDALDDIIEVVLANRFSGIIVNNTTIERPVLLKETQLAKEIGGLSGAAITQKSNQILQYLKSKTEDKLIYIGVGGVMNSDDAKQRIKSGASWIQVYTGFIYEGPWFIKKLKKSLLQQS